MPHRLVIAAALALALVSPAVAAAEGTWDGTAWHYPTERLANNAMLASMNTSALAFWHERNVYPSEHVTYLLVDTPLDLAGPDAPTGALGRGDQRTATIWITAEEVGYAQAPNSRGDCLFLYGVVTHELGHVGGLAHTATGVMSTDGVVPGVATAWCREWTRHGHPHAATSRRRRHSHLNRQAKTGSIR